jgi:hypothetical protein
MLLDKHPRQLVCDFSLVLKEGDAPLILRKSCASLRAWAFSPTIRYLDHAGSSNTSINSFCRADSHDKLWVFICRPITCMLALADRCLSPGAVRIEACSYL